MFGLGAWFILYIAYWVSTIIFWKEVKVEGIVTMKIPYSWFYENHDKSLVVSNCRYLNEGRIGCKKDKISIRVGFSEGPLEKALAQNDLDHLEAKEVMLGGQRATLVLNLYPNVINDSVYFIDYGIKFLTFHYDMNTGNINVFENWFLLNIRQQVLNSVVLKK